MLINTYLPSLQSTMLATQQLLDNVTTDKYRTDKQISEHIQPYENQARAIQSNLTNLTKEIESYTATAVLEELGMVKADNPAGGKEIWSMEEAAEYYGVSKRTFQNMVCRFKQDDTPPSWLLLPTGQIKKTRILVKKFKEWYALPLRRKVVPKYKIKALLGMSET